MSRPHPLPPILTTSALLLALLTPQVKGLRAEWH